MVERLAQMDAREMYSPNEDDWAEFNEWCEWSDAEGSFDLIVGDTYYNLTVTRSGNIVAAKNLENGDEVPLPIMRILLGQDRKAEFLLAVKVVAHFA